MSETDEEKREKKKRTCEWQRYGGAGDEQLVRLVAELLPDGGLLEHDVHALRVLHRLLLHGLYGHHHHRDRRAHVLRLDRVRRLQQLQQVRQQCRTRVCCNAQYAHEYTVQYITNNK